jgi:nicotinamidase-related amidase
MNRSVLLLLDYVNDLVHERGRFAEYGYPAFVKAHGILDKVNATISKARARGIPVVFVRVGFSPGYAECPAASPLFGSLKNSGALQLGTWGTELHEALNRTDADLVVTKHRVSAFYATPLEAILRSLGAQTLLLGGVATDFVVESTAREGHDRDYAVVVLEDLCGAASEEEHGAAIRFLPAVARVTVSTEAPELN